MKTIYRNANVSEVAYLLTEPKIRFLGLEPKNDRTYYFCFTPLLLCERMVLSFISGNALVSARVYADSMRRAKDIIFSHERNSKRNPVAGKS